MSIVIVMGPLLAAVVTAVAAFAASKIAKCLGMFHMRRAASLSLGVIVFFVLVWPMTQWYARATTTTRIAMNPRDGENLLEFVGLPPNTTDDFCYRSSLVGVTVLADFDMAEEDFLRWMNSQDWNVVWFQIEDDDSMVQLPDGTYADTTVYPVRQYESGKPTTIRRGHYFFTARKDIPDNTKKITYDLDSGRAYYEHTTY